VLHPLAYAVIRAVLERVAAAEAHREAGLLATVATPEPAPEPDSGDCQGGDCQPCNPSLISTHLEAKLHAGLEEAREAAQDAAALDEELAEWASGTEESHAGDGSQRPMREIAAEMGLEKLGNKVRCSNRLAQRKKFGTFQQCVDELGGGDNTYLGFWIHNNKKKSHPRDLHCLEQ